MEKIIINGKEIDYRLEKEQNVGEVIGSLLSWLGENNEYCHAILIDETAVSLSNRNEWASRPLDGVQKVTLETISPILLREYIPKINDVSILLQTNRGKEAMEVIANTSALLTMLLSATANIESIDRDKLQGILNELMNALQELSVGLKSNDTILIGDILEYEVVPKLKTLLGLF